MQIEDLFFDRALGNQAVHVDRALLADAVSSVGGLILRELGRVPLFNETVAIDGTEFQVLRADSRRIYTLLVAGPPDAGDPR